MHFQHGFSKHWWSFLCVCTCVPPTVHPREGLRVGGPVRSSGVQCFVTVASGFFCLWLFSQGLSISVLTWIINPLRAKKTKYLQKIFFFFFFKCLDLFHQSGLHYRSRVDLSHSHRGYNGYFDDSVQRAFRNQDIALATYFQGMCPFVRHCPVHSKDNHSGGRKDEYQWVQIRVYSFIPESRKENLITKILKWDSENWPSPFHGGVFYL